MKIKKNWTIMGIILFAATILCGITFYRIAAHTESLSESEKKRQETAKALVQSVYTEAYQNHVEENLEQKKSTGNYTEETMLIEENPYGTNTLSLYVYFNTEEKVSVSYKVEVSDPDIPDFEKTPAGESDYGTEHEFQVLGLIPEEINTIVFTLRGEDGNERTYSYVHEMGSLLGDEEIQLKNTKAKEEGDYISDGLYVILGNDSDEMDFMYYYDNFGILRGEIPLLGYRSHRLLFQDGLMYYSISDNKMAAVNALGKVEKIYDTENYSLHHDYVLDDDGNLLVLATDTTSDSIEDQVIKINAATGEITNVLDLGDLFPDYKKTCVENEDGDLDWMHINTIQWLGNGEVLLSSRETSTILVITDLYCSPKIKYMIGEKTFWEGTGYENLLLEKDESLGSFSGTGGQHSVTYVQDETTNEGEYYLYLFNNNFGTSVSNPSYDWTQIEGIETSVTEGVSSYFYKYKIDENQRNYYLVQSFQVPYSAYVSSVQEYKENVIVDSGMKGIFGEYDENGSLLQEFQMKMDNKFIYRVYKYDFMGFYFA